MILRIIVWVIFIVILDKVMLRMIVGGIIWWRLRRGLLVSLIYCVVGVIF